MIARLGKLVKWSRITNLSTKHLSNLVASNKFSFTLTSKKSQLILHTEGEIEKMHSRKKDK